MVGFGIHGHILYSLHFRMVYIMLCSLADRIHLLGRFTHYLNCDQSVFECLLALAGLSYPNREKLTIKMYYSLLKEMEHIPETLQLILELSMLLPE